ncbi:MAG: H-X9-DG-CTERM domain-containing protein [Planctomycetota bacterium]|jgi:prepilin-type processing-associated H-X9-DG protein
MAEMQNGAPEQKPRNTSATYAALAIVVVFVVFFILPEWCHHRHELPPRIVCGTNLAGIVKSMVLYAGQDELGRAPDPDKWCDLLIQCDFFTCKIFVCKGSDAVEGESSYAMNKNIAGRSFASLPADLVVLFETDYGKNPAGRDALLKDRACYQIVDDQITDHARPDTQVYTTENHKGEGCNVAFADGRVEFVKAADLDKLKWKPNP